MPFQVRTLQRSCRPAATSANSFRCTRPYSSAYVDSAASPRSTFHASVAGNPRLICTRMPHQPSCAAVSARSARRRAERRPLSRAHSEVITSVTSRKTSRRDHPPAPFVHHHDPGSPPSKRSLQVLKAETAQPLLVLHYYHCDSGTPNDAAHLPAVPIQTSAGLLDHFVRPVALLRRPFHNPAHLPVQVFLLSAEETRAYTTQRPSFSDGTTT